jgi:pimeloyl-ACP methyl ester carboxylesterase
MTAIELPDRLHSWRAAGRSIRVDGTEVWYRIKGQGDWLVCFHGFPTSSWDWHRVLPLLSQHRKVLIFDFPGYGLSAKPPGRDYSLLRQMDAAEALMTSLGVESFDLLAHDMGNSVACELLHRLETGLTALRPRSLTLLNGGVYMDLHQPLPTQRLLRMPVLGRLTARFSSWRLFRHQYPKVYADPGQFDEAHYREQWALLLNHDGRRTLASVAGYMRERVRLGERWLGPLHRTSLPLALIWGQKDPIAVKAIALRLCRNNPGARLTLLPDSGHYPQLEAPRETVSAWRKALSA